MTEVSCIDLPHLETGELPKSHKMACSVFWGGWVGHFFFIGGGGEGMVGVGGSNEAKTVNKDSTENFKNSVF